MILAFIFFFLNSANAACTAPVGDAGHVTFVAPDMKYCDGSNWNTMTVSLRSTACTVAGAINYTGGDLQFCNGSYWVSMNSSVTDSTCTGALVGAFNWRNSKMEFCDGTNWNVTKPSGSYMAIAHTTSPYVTIYNRSDWSKLQNPATLPTGDAKNVAFSPNGAYLAVTYTASPYLTVYNTSDWSTVTLGSAVTSSADAIAWSPNGSYLAIGMSAAPRIKVYDTSTWNNLANPSTLPGAAPTAMAFTIDNTRLLVGWGGTTFFYILDTTTSPWSKITNPSTMPPGTSRGVAVSPDGSKAAVTINGASNIIKLIVYSTADWSTLHTVTTTDEYRGAAFSSDSSKLLVTNNTTNAIMSFNTTTWASSNLQSSIFTDVRGVRYSPDFNVYGIVSGSTSPYLKVYSTATDTAYSAPTVLPTGGAGYNGLSFYP